MNINQFRSQQLHSVVSNYKYGVQPRIGKASEHFYKHKGNHMNRLFILKPGVPCNGEAMCFL
jgi:hypothetical protein